MFGPLPLLLTLALTHGAEAVHALQSASLFQAIRKDLLSTDRYFTNLAQTLTVEKVALACPTFPNGSLTRRACAIRRSNPSLVLATDSGPQVPSGRITPQGVVPTFSQLLIVNIS